MTAAAEPSSMSAEVAAFVSRMQGFTGTLAAIGTPDAVAAIEALTGAMETMSAALQLAAAAMVAVTPTEH